MNFLSLGLSIFFLGIGHSFPVSAATFQSSGEKLSITTLSDEFDLIWGIDFLPSGQAILTERRGRAWLFDPLTKKRSPLSGLPKVATGGQGGLMDVAVHPLFAENSWVYLSYSIKIKGGRTTEIARARLKENQLTDWQILFTAQPAFSSTRHFGSRIVFDGKGHIFFSVGDRGHRDLAQSLETHNGKIMRLKEDGSVPKDNPFIARKKALKEIWSYGHRNPQGLYYDRSSGTLYEQEHGPRGGDEINIIQKGLNYGWPVVSFGREYLSRRQVGEGTSKEGMEPPIKQFTPSIAPAALVLYQHEKIKGWQGNLFSTALALTHLNRLPLTRSENQIQVGQEERLLINLDERLRALRVSPEGHLWVTTDSGKLLEIAPESSSHP